MPDKATVFRWLSAEGNKDFCKQYIRAREAQADSLVDDILSIADDARNDWMKRNGENATGYQENGEALRRSALRIDARKWLAGKMAPKKYGDKQHLERACRPRRRPDHAGGADHGEAAKEGVNCSRPSTRSAPCGAAERLACDVVTEVEPVRAARRPPLLRLAAVIGLARAYWSRKPLEDAGSDQDRPGTPGRP